jgi:hypothetical protein
MVFKDINHQSQQCVSFHLLRTKHFMDQMLVHLLLSRGFQVQSSHMDRDVQGDTHSRIMR